MPRAATASDPGTCPLFEFMFFVDSLRTISSRLKCSASELEKSKQIKQLGFDLFSETSQLYSEQFVFASTELEGLATSEDSQFYVIESDFKVEKGGNALSIILLYEF